MPTGTCPDCHEHKSLDVPVKNGLGGQVIYICQPCYDRGNY